MIESASKGPLIAIACGGTGGHLFPGLAVGRALQERGAAVMLLVSRKEVDQRALESAGDFPSMALPAVGYSAGHGLAFLRASVAAYRAAARLFRSRPPRAVLAMGGFTALAPVLAARRHRAATYLHESNAVAGRANRWLAPWVDAVFLGFPEARTRIRNSRIVITGTPVRSGFHPRKAAECRRALGLEPEGAVLLVMGGSQGASAINRLLLEALPHLHERLRGLRIIHLTGPKDYAEVQSAFRAWPHASMVAAFFERIELAMGAADVAVTRAGGSCLAELAAMELPAVLVPYPGAADDHQLTNARAYVQAGAARMLEQREASPGRLAALVAELVSDRAALARMREALRGWHRPDAAARIVIEMLGKATGDETAGTRRQEVPQSSPAAGGGELAGTRRQDLRVA